MTRRNCESWTLGVAILLACQPMSLAETRTKPPTAADGSRSQQKASVTRTRYQAPSTSTDRGDSVNGYEDVSFGSSKVALDDIEEPGKSSVAPVDEPLVPDAVKDPIPGTNPKVTYFDEPLAEVDCLPFWAHRDSIWADWLFLRARGADVTYATPVNGTLATAVPIGDRSIAAFDYDSGFRVGGAWAIDNCSSLTANYTWFRNAIDETATVPAGGGAFLLADTVHPNTINVAADSLAATARYEVNLQSADLNYKGLWCGEECYAINYLVGLKYARLEQQFNGTYSILGTTTVDTNVNFNGVGPRFGLEGERLCGHHGFMVYSKSYVNFLVGSSKASFLQQNIFTGVQARTGQEDSRILTVPELELGAGWQSCNGCFRITAGYYLAAWFNMLTTPEYLSMVRTTPNTFEDQIKTLTLDGLTVRAEVRF